MGQWNVRQTAATLTSDAAMAVFLATIVFCGTVTPALGIGLASGSGFAATGNDELQVVGNQSSDVLDTESADALTNGSATLQKMWARTLLLNLRQNTTTDRYEKSLLGLNESIQLATGPSQVANKRAFNYDAAAVDELELTDEQDRNEQIILAAHLIASADNETATEQIDYAQQVLNRTEQNLSTGVRRSSQAHIRNAERALDRGQSKLASSPGDDLDSRKAAIQQFRVAWLQATRAIERIDAGTSPQVTISTRGDPKRNGSQPLSGQVRGEIFDVKPQELSNATVTIGENRTTTVPINVTDRRSVATFAVNVTLEDRITSVTVSVTDTESDRLSDSRSDETVTDQEEAKNGAESNGPPKRGPPGHANNDGGNRKSAGPPDHAGNGNGAGPPGRGDKPDDSASANRPSDTGSDTVRFDGDGLPDLYETGTLDTDPQDPDSDSSRTAADVADNGIIDGIEDFDDDGVTNYHEGVFDTNPFSPDTDDDTLPDQYEIQYPRLNQTAADTDSDGVRDPAWDPDNDTLTISQERDAGTRPFVADADQDGLNDSREVEANTNASDPDTDDDGLSDGKEVRLGTDPLSPDSDGDGVVDANETYRTSTTNESLGVSVTLTGTGDVANGVTIENGSSPQFDRESVQEAQVTPFVDLESEQSFAAANVTFEYNASQLGDTNESDLVVFRYNESTNLYEPLNTTVDAANNTITGRTEHFTRFVVFDVRNWASNFLATRPTGGVDEGSGQIQPVDVTFIIDSSGSMARNDPQEFRKQASKEFVGALVEGDRASVVDFDSNAFVSQSLTAGFGSVNQSIDRLDAYGGTNIGAGIAASNREFARNSNDSRAKVAILLTDGQGSGGRAQARQAADQNVTIYTIGFGGADGNKLRDIARMTGGNYTFVSSASDLPEVFSRVAQNVSQGADSDGDGLSDALETRGVPTSEGLIQTDPYSNDTDGDGLTDREELGSPTSFGKLSTSTKRVLHRTLRKSGYTPANATSRVWIAPNSDPTMVDTDGDGRDDDAETTEQMTIARTANREDTLTVLESGKPSSEAIEDAYETLQVRSDPWNYDTDNDDLSDARERVLGTNPEQQDTDGDGITDESETQSRNDPTLYDARPPTIEVQNSFYRIPKNSLDTTYYVNAILGDEAGLERAVLLKDGEVRQSAAFDPADRDSKTVVTQLEFTDRTVSTGGVDTSNIKSTFVSGIRTIGDAASDATGTVADSTLGTTVYVRASDANDNSQRRVGVQRANFYGAVSGELFNGDSIIDRTAARQFGTVSGLSASFGVVFKDVSTFIDDPSAFVDGIGALIDVIGKEGLGVTDTLIDTYVRQFERKQAQNNPYGTLNEKDNPQLYDIYAQNWYEGYTGGFLLKLVLSGGVGKAAKSTVKNVDRVSDIADRLQDTRALRALARVEDATEAAKGRAVARVLLASDDATEAVLSQADTAGQAVRLWRIQRNTDLDVDSRPEADQSAVGDFLIRNGEDGAQVVADGGDDAIAVIRWFEGVNDDTADRLADLKAVGGLDTSDLNRLENALDSGEIDGNDLHRTSELLSEEQGYVGEDIGVREVLRVSEQRGDISETIALTQDSDGNVVWLEQGQLDPVTRQSGEWIKDDGGAGWKHIAHNHLSKPSGNDFRRYGDEYSDIQGAKRLVFTALDRGNRVRVDGDIFYQYQVPDSGKYISVLVGDNGYTVTIKPDKVGN